MSDSLQRRTVIFIVRVWAEYLNEQPPGWRGVLEQVANGRKLNFTNLDELIELIRKQTLEQTKTEGKK